MKKIFFFVALISFGFVFNSTLISKSYSANICATSGAGTSYGAGGSNAGVDAEGALLVKDEGGGDVTSFAKVATPTVFDFGGDQDSCDITPDNYEMTFYEIGLCKETPLRAANWSHSNTIDHDVSSCSKIFTDSSGKVTNIQPGVETDLITGAIILPIGSYSYVYAIINSHVRMKHIQKFINSDGTDATIVGYKNSGSVCYTGKDDNGDIFVNTHTFELQGSSVGGPDVLHGIALPTSFTGTTNTARYKCGTYANAIASGANDWTTTIINSFDERLLTVVNGNITGYDATKFRNAVPTWQADADVSGITIAYSLRKTDNTSIATNQEDARRILFIQKHDKPIDISELTVGLKFELKTNNAINIRVFQEASSDTTLMGTRMMANPPVMNIKTKTRRARGTWR